MRHHALSFTALDFETGDSQHDSACAVGLVLVRGGRIVRREHRLIRPPRPPLLSHVGIHGLGAKLLAKQRTFGEQWPGIGMLLRGADFFAAHGTTDASVLRTCCTKIGKRPPRQPFVNTVVLARDVWGIFPTTLGDVCRYLRIPLDPHDALSDAAACAEIVRAAGPENVRRHIDERSLAMQRRRRRR